MVVAIHSTVARARPSAAPGWPTTPTLPTPGAAAYADALRLSRAMTYKNALAGLDHGGGKGVILADSPATPRTPRSCTPTAGWWPPSTAPTSPPATSA